MLLARWLRLATADEGWGSGFAELGGGGGGAAAAAAAALASFVFDEEDSCDLDLLSCGTSQSASWRDNGRRAKVFLSPFMAGGEAGGRATTTDAVVPGMRKATRTSVGGG